MRGTALSETLTKLVRRALLDPDSAPAALKSLKLKLEAQGGDPHTVHLVVGDGDRDGPAAIASKLANSYRDEAKRLRERVATLEAALAAREAQVAQQADQIAALSAPRRNVERNTTEWVRRLQYTRAEAQREKDRIEKAVKAGKLSKASAAKFKRRVTLRTNP